MVMSLRLPAVHLMPGDEVVDSSGRYHRIMDVDKSGRYAPTSKVQVEFVDGRTARYDSSDMILVRAR